MPGGERHVDATPGVILPTVNPLPLLLLLATAPAPATKVGEVVVAAGPGPKVAASYPADGATVGAGVLVVKITFNQPMKPDAWSYGRVDGAAFPSCLADPRLLADQRTFVLLCTVPPQGAFAMEINSAPAFASEQERAAKRTVLRFSTTDQVVRDMHEALASAGLTDADEPVMSWHDSGAGVSQSPPAK
jgi:hypothetical protein